MNSPMELGFDFDAPDPRRMVHADARDTEIAAAAAVQPRLNAMHDDVRKAFQAKGPMTDEQLEQLPQFADWAPSTARKRRSELMIAGELQAVGDTVNSRNRRMVVWGLKVSPDGVARTPRAAEPSLVAAALPPPRTPSGEFQIGERVRVRDTRQLAEVYEVRNCHEPAFAQRVRAGWSVMIEGTIVGRDEWFDGDELERLS